MGVPAGAQTGDYVIIVLSGDDIVIAQTIPGFTILDTQAAFSSADGQSGKVYYKKLTANDTGSYTANVAYNAPWELTAYLFRGRDQANPPTISTFAAQAAGVASPAGVTTNGLTALNGDDLFVIDIPDNTVTGSVSGFTQPSGYTSLGIVGAGFSYVLAAYKENVAAGATGSLSSTITLSSGNTGWGTWLVRIPRAPLAIDSQEVSGTAHRVSNNHTLSWAFNNVAGNLLVVGAIAAVDVLLGGTATVSGVTYNGVAMTAGPTISWDGNRSYVQLFYMANPPTGSHTVAVTGTGTLGTNYVILGGAISFSNADTTTPFGATSSAKQDVTANQHPQAGSITATSGNYVLGVGGYGSGTAETSDHAVTFALVGGTSSAGDNIGSDIALSSGAAINAGFTFATSADFWGMVAAEVRALGASSVDNTTKPALPGMFTPQLIQNAWF